MRFWTIATIVASVSCLVLLIAILGVADPALGNEVLKILVQFLLVTVAGGIFLIFINARRDEDRKDDAREAEVRTLVEQIRSAYRKLEIVKRRLRSQMAVQERGRDRTRDLPYRIPTKAFEAAMEELLAAQIESEQVRDRVISRQDLLSQERIERLRMALNYAAGYFADVYEDVEDCVVARTDEYYEVTADCRGLADFLGRAHWRQPPAPPWPAAVQAQYEILKQDDLPPPLRHEALCRIEAMRAFDPDRLRFRLIATQCISLASTDIHLALLRRRWLTPFARHDAWLD